jgi:O-antigen ligase
VNSVVVTTSVKTVLDNVFEFCLIYYIFAKSITNVQTIHKILAYSVAALVVCSVFGAVERFTHWNVTDIFPAVMHRLGDEIGHVGTGNRIRSTFPHPILFGNGLALGIPWVLYLISLAKTGTQKVFLWVALVLMAYNLYRTSSRGPWLALVLSFVLLLIFSHGSIRKYLMIIAFVTFATMILRPGVVKSLQDTYRETRNPDSVRGGSYQYRYELMRAGVHALSGDFRRSLWGFGPESFYFLGLEEQIPYTDKTEVLVSCDNAWVEIMIETGYVGLFLVATLILSAAFLSWRGFKTLSPPGNSLCLVFLANLGAYAFMMIGVANFGWGQQAFMLWIILALAVVYPRLAGAEITAKRDTAFLPQKSHFQLADATQA